ncbi:MAG: hypothetical protein Q4G07_11145 [Oscillospiraceae bacterium]|nr:hypothetical protein [Oscillospiraceae bacterium]
MKNGGYAGAEAAGQTEVYALNMGTAAMGNRRTPVRKVRELWLPVKEV